MTVTTTVADPALAADLCHLRLMMLPSLRSRTLNAARAVGNVRRYSTPVDSVPKVGETAGAPASGALRPHLNIPVNPNHGLYAFFRKREKDGKLIHDSLEDHFGLRDVFGK
jgi:large subunit ribosomal protein L47